MGTCRRWALAGLIGLACAASACSTSGAPAAVSIVALGDSVPRGTNCDCRPYPPLTADMLTVAAGRTVTATNDSVSGLTTAGVLDQLKSDSSVIGHVHAANVVEIEVGANDVPYTTSCGTEVDCYAPRIPAIEKNLAEIVRRVRELAHEHELLVVLIDYWSVWLGGSYAAAKGDAYVAAAEEVTDRVNGVIRSTAAETGSAYVDLRAAFKGPDYAYDETRYLSSDGDHPNAAGHEQIALAVEAVVEHELRISD
jgi:lysophospholipase L1-like esterase